VRQQRYAEAQLANDEARLVAQQVERQDMLFATQVLGARLQFLLHQMTSAEARHNLEVLRHTWTAEKEQAALYYEQWRLSDQTDESARRAAGELYRTLYARSPNSDYRERYLELTGEALPPPPPLPDLPPFITQQPLDVDALLRKVDQAAGLD
jgi:hypothetical protein